MSEVHFFWGGVFSQWHPARFEWRGRQFGCAEQAMMWAKADLFGDEEAAGRILGETDPGRQKAIGRQVRGFDERVWDARKLEIVTEINLSRFAQNKGLRRKLFQTSPLPLAEASPVDTIWGIGLDAEAARQTPPEDWPGQNLLGRILMDVRDRLAARHPTEHAACAAAHAEEIK